METTNQTLYLEVRGATGGDEADRRLSALVFCFAAHLAKAEETERGFRVRAAHSRFGSREALTADRNCPRHLAAVRVWVGIAEWVIA